MTPFVFVGSIDSFEQDFKDSSESVRTGFSNRFRLHSDGAFVNANGFAKMHARRRVGAIVLWNTVYVGDTSNYISHLEFLHLVFVVFTLLFGWDLGVLEVNEVLDCVEVF